MAAPLGQSISRGLSRFGQALQQYALVRQQQEQDRAKEEKKQIDDANKKMVEFRSAIIGLKPEYGPKIQEDMVSVAGDMFIETGELMSTSQIQRMAKFKFNEMQKQAEAQAKEDEFKNTLTSLRDIVAGGGSGQLPEFDFTSVAQDLGVAPADIDKGEQQLAMMDFFRKFNDQSGPNVGGLEGGPASLNPSAVIDVIAQMRREQRQEEEAAARRKGELGELTGEARRERKIIEESEEAKKKAADKEIKRKRAITKEYISKRDAIKKENRVADVRYQKELKSYRVKLQELEANLKSGDVKKADVDFFKAENEPIKPKAQKIPTIQEFRRERDSLFNALGEVELGLGTSQPVQVQEGSLADTIPDDIIDSMAVNGVEGLLSPVTDFTTVGKPTQARIRKIIRNMIRAAEEQDADR